MGTHVIPVDDLVEHDTNGACVCGPTLEPHRSESGGVGWLMVHHSLDGREMPPAEFMGKCADG